MTSHLPFAQEQNTYFYLCS